jgi:hypothetical protein
VSNASARPLHDIALCLGATKVRQMLYCIWQSKAVPYELKTDSCPLCPQKRRKVAVPALRYCDLHELRDRYDPAEKMRCLDEHFAMTPNAWHQPVFRCAAAEDKDRMHTEPALPERKAERIHTKMPWRDMDAIADEEWVPPTSLALLSSLTDRCATILHPRQARNLTPSNRFVMQNPGRLLFGGFRIPIFTRDRNSVIFFQEFCFIPLHGHQ